MTLTVLQYHDFAWDEADTISGEEAGTTGYFNISEWQGAEGYFWYKNASSSPGTNYDMWLQSAPNDTGPWVNQKQLVDSSASTTTQGDTLDLSGAGPFIRFAFFNADSCLTTAEIDYFIVSFKKTTP